MVGLGPKRSPTGARRILLYSHDTYGLGHLRRSRTIASALVAAESDASALIVTGSPVAGRFDFPERIDYVRLPGVVKQPDGSYTSSALTLGIDETVALRSALLTATEAEFRPDLVIVDKEPWGFKGELHQMLEAARMRGARIVLGLRDVLDDPETLAREWGRKRAVDAIDAFYDDVLIYGLPEVCRPLDGISLPARLSGRVLYTGYLRREAPEAPEGAFADVPERPFILVTTGGGGDGAALIDWVLRAYENDPALEPRALVIYGPFLAAEDRVAFDQRVAALDGRVEAIGFHARVEGVLDRAAGIVSMGGYNTFCEVLSLDKPALIVPRTRPRREQLIRAEAAERLGLARMLHAPRDGRGWEVMAAAIRALPDQPLPSASAPPGLLDGLERIAALADASPADRPAPALRAAGG